MNEKNEIATIKRSESDHSTGPDKFTGWSQKQSYPKLRQIPLIFANSSVDLISKSLTSFGSAHIQRVVYMGPRFGSNMKAFKAYAKNNKFNLAKESQVYGIQTMQRFIFNHAAQKDKFFPIRASQYRLFTGVNPTCQKSDLRFDSDFECGNLDLAVYVNPVEYDIMMRVDSNTKGHTSWFYFKVGNITPKQKIKFNIINFVKSYNLYKQGMKPYAFKKSQGEWTQTGINIQFRQRKFRYDDSQTPQMMGNLSFTYNFTDSEQVYFAYCIPYSYSYLLYFLENIKEKYPQFIKICMKDQSTGGLPIPVLTITNFTTSDANKKVHLCTGRMHPGQTQGSWMMQGFIRYICSPDGHYLRQKTVFKILPMVNVDGVVLGNFRTGIGGRDLNRAFYNPQKYQQIKLIRSLAQTYKPTVFIDFHGHSAKKNVFLYGPDYKIQEKNYLSSRMFPKLIAKKTQAFRYYSCSFKISNSKRTTGRAVLLRQHQIPFSFTIQASTHCHGGTNNQKLFNMEQYIEMGINIGKGLSDFVMFLSILPKRVEMKQKLKEKEQGKNSKKSQKSDKNIQPIDPNQIQDTMGQNDQLKNFQNKLSAQQYELFKEILNAGDELNFDDFKQDQKNTGEQEDSDCENQAEDYSEKQLDRYFTSNGKAELEKIQERQKTPKIKKVNLTNQKSKNKIKKTLQIIQELKPSNSMFQAPKPKKLQKSFQLKRRGSPQENFVHIDSNLLQKSKTIEQKVDFYKKFDAINSDIFSNKYQQFLAPRKYDRVLYDWQGRSRSNAQINNFSTLNMSPSQFQKIQLKQRQRTRKVNEVANTINKKQQPFFTIKKSILPMLGRSGNSSQIEQRNMLSSILQQHQRKKRTKFNKQYKILHI